MPCGRSTPTPALPPQGEGACAQIIDLSDGVDPPPTGGGSLLLPQPLAPRADVFAQHRYILFPSMPG